MTPWNDQNKQHSKKYSYIIMYQNVLQIIFNYHFRHKMLASGDIFSGIWTYFDKNLWFVRQYYSVHTPCFGHVTVYDLTPVEAFYIIYIIVLLFYKRCKSKRYLLYLCMKILIINMINVLLFYFPWHNYNSMHFTVYFQMYFLICALLTVNISNVRI